MFTDRVTIDLIAGKGGNGIVAWRREKYLPKGGPYGGNGGRGGSITVSVDPQLFSLDWFRHRRILKAENGKQGGSNCRKGKDGKDLKLSVPCGTLIKDAKTKEVLYDLTEAGQKVKICSGGAGGRGNASFKSSTNRAPNFCTPGKLGTSLRVELELKLIADVGLVGFPNAGKTTLINALAETDAKTASYPFTTLHPNIGFVELEDYRRIYIADIPGIIERAHQNRGLGFEFLRHIERTKLLLFVLDASGYDERSPAEDFRILQHELRHYQQEILEKPLLIALNKIDEEGSKDPIRTFYKKYPQFQKQIIEISALTGEGLDHLIESIVDLAKETDKI